MGTKSFLPWCVLAGAAVCAAATMARAETVRLEVKRLPKSPTQATTASVDSPFASRSMQRIVLLAGTQAPKVRIAGVPSPTEFKQVIQKEPQYESERPLRGVMRLGSWDFGLAVDAPKATTAPEQTPPSKPGVLRMPSYTKLYLDANHNGDLTDDPVVEAETGKSPIAAYATFPRLDVMTSVEGKAAEHSFYLRIYGRPIGTVQYLFAYANGAAYREGEITLDGVKRQLVLVDADGNARYDDKPTVRDLPDGTPYVMPGDMLFVDPKREAGTSSLGTDPTMNDDLHFMGKWLCLAGRLYAMEISPAGDALTLSRPTVPTGFASNPNPGYRAILRGEQGLLKVVGDASGRTELPAGNWRLLGYTIDRTGKKLSDPASDSAGSRNLLSGIAGRPNWTLVSARLKKDHPPVQVQHGQSVVIPFGPPFKPVVDLAPRSGAEVNLKLSLVGAGGDVCSNFYVEGKRPGEPSFTIAGPDGKPVVEGKFKFG